MAEITVIGTGYVGLVTGACFAHLGHQVICVDVDGGKIAILQAGDLPIYEEGLAEIMRESTAVGRLSFQVGHDTRSLASEFHYLCVPTPQALDGSADLSYLEAAAAEIGPHIPRDAIIVNKSTVPVGSTRLVEQVLKRRDVHVVSNPEFLREGSAVSDFLHPDRVVIGSEDHAAAVRVAALYLALGANILVTDPASAEMIKYASNAFLATKLSFINAVAAVCEGVGADVADVRLGMGYDKRIGLDFLQPGPGWGGSCFPKDSLAMIRIAEESGYDFSLLQGVVDVNNEQFERVVTKICAANGGTLAGAEIGMLGIAFKAGTDDSRMSPAIEVARRLVAQGARVKAYDPAARIDLDGVAQVDDAYAVCEQADVVALLTEWAEFKWLDFAKVAGLMRGDVVVDTRNILDRGSLMRHGLRHVVIGRA